MNEPRLTSTEVAALVNKSRRTIHRAVTDGKLTPAEVVQLGAYRAYLFTEQEAQRYRDSITSAA